MSADSTAQVATRLFVGGRWRDGAAGRIPVTDPGNGRTIGTVEQADERDVADALDAASAAFRAWSTMVPAQRGAILKKAAALLGSRAAEIATTLMLEAGKTRAEARGEIQRAIDTLEWNGEQAARVEGRVIGGAVAGSRRYSVPTPLGVVAAFTAWNFPAVLGARKLGGTLAAGCTVVLKAAESAPGTAAAIVQALVDAGLPDGVVNLVFGDPPTVSAQLLGSPVVKAVTFTGSTAVGKRLAALAAPRLIRGVFELGGHAPVLVCEDADVHSVVAVTSPAKFGSAGQSCVAPSRYLVHRSLYDAFASRLTDHARSLRLGHGSDPETTMGSLVHQGRVDAMLRLTQDAVGRGARLLCGGRQPERDGFFFEPTVLADVPHDADIMSEEPFGPIAALVPFDDVDEAIELANAPEYAFAAYVFTDSLTRREIAVERLAASNIGINQMAPSLPDAPLGGLDASGYGYEGGAEGVLSFTQLRLVSQSAPPR
ncbi:aldehyde dehydrogenase family protein [Pseudonocardia alaniniphila]|uniref:Aldehyde dehydrogenase family protein n=1 Tax=Pseudonocardia alaniniphila TaxID=75291 RepID=A0ABS9TFM8_9PSEU|nr:aldehyde dehydrogenase family protein [Pseudonocardia alaniniphila]MCH6167312.1 aldehyde dehydrogenase family protein [Pseudonocardia alaniniphila]